MSQIETLNQIENLIAKYNETFCGAEEMFYSRKWFNLLVVNYEAGMFSRFYFSMHGPVLEPLRIFIETGDVNPLIQAASRVTNGPWSDGAKIG